MLLRHSRNLTRTAQNMMDHFNYLGVLKHLFPFFLKQNPSLHKYIYISNIFYKLFLHLLKPKRVVNIYIEIFYFQQEKRVNLVFLNTKTTHPAHLGCRSSPELLVYCPMSSKNNCTFNRALQNSNIYSPENRHSWCLMEKTVS